jgi:dolichol-phosphate mannosyltransferase
MSVFVVIPCYRVSAHICDVIKGFGSEVDTVIVVDDCCPEGSGALVEKTCTDTRVRVIYHDTNQGVGGAVLTGYQAAIEAGAEVIVKIDGDGQMDASLIPNFIEPILNGEADYTKGNRFYDLEEIRAMPKMRLFGNAILSFMTKLSSGYWDLFDPTNGYTAIHASVASHLPFQKISRSYFFETDILFRLNTLRAVVIDIPISANYGDEISNLKISKIIGEFLLKHARNFIKRIFYNYYLRDLSLASIELPIGILMLVAGSVYGAYHWIASAQDGVNTPAGTVMLASLPILMGLQLILAFLGFDIASVPRRPKQKAYRTRRFHNKG